jgi:hypothetical protein
MDPETKKAAEFCKIPSVGCVRITDADQRLQVMTLKLAIAREMVAELERELEEAGKLTGGDYRG